MKVSCKRTILFLAAFLILLIEGGFSASASAEVKGPGWFFETAEPVSPEEARAYYERAGTLKAANGTFRPMDFDEEGPIALLSSATTITPEITELARALNHDPKLIYDHIYNNIEYVPYFGSLKGATLTLLDGCGNDFDQASLMIAMLRASGYTANFVHGVKFLSYRYLASWLEVKTQDQSPQEGWPSDDIIDLAREAWVSGGIPNMEDTYTTPFGNVIPGLRVEGVWVTAVIDGNMYVFDPSYKCELILGTLDLIGYSSKPKIDIGGAIGYSRTDLIAATTTGATVTDESVQNINQSGLNNKLKEYTTNMISVLRSQHPNDNVIDIIGGRKIVEKHLSAYNILPPYPYISTTTEEWAEIPAAYTATLRIQHQGIDHTFEVPEIASRRLTITYSGESLTPELRLDGELIASGSSTSRGTKYDMVISINHPYAAEGGTDKDQTGTYKCESGFTYAIVSDFAGGNTDNLIRKRQKELGRNLDNALPNTSEPVLGETLNIMGASWLRETRLAEALLDRITSTVFLRHHAIGLMAQESGYYIDVKMSCYSGCYKNEIGSYSGSISFMTRLSLGSAFEHAILEQMMGSDNPGASTIKLTNLANSQGGKIFWANSGNFTGIQPQLQNYSAETLTDIQNEINAGKTVILPENGQLGINQWQGTGYAVKYVAPNNSSASLDMVISGGYYGGYSSFLGELDAASVWVDITTIYPDHSYDFEIPTPVSLEPVDMATGAYLYDHTDISLGQAAPMGLEFHRSYNSSRNREKRSMGHGWQHNYDIFLRKVSSADPGLGLRTPIDAAAMIVNLYIADDLMRNEDNITGWVTMFLAHKWAVDQLIDNAVSVNIGGQVAEYIKLPDGSYNNPPGSTTDLVKNPDETFSLKERFGTQTDFDSNDRVLRLRDINGNTLSFNYIGDNLTSVEDAVGRTLTLNYTGDKLTSVTDSEGRSVSYTYNADNDLAGSTDVAGKSWSYSYDDCHRITSLVNPLEVATVTNIYDSLGRVMTQESPRDGSIATYNFYFSGFRNVEEDPYGRRIIYYLDEKARTYAVEDALGNKAVNTFDGQNHTISIKNARNYTTAFAYDGNQNLTKVKDALNKETNNAYDTQFRLTDVSDPLNHTTHLDYDTEHHLIEMTDAASNTRNFAYYANGLTSTMTDGRGTQTDISYDGNSHPLTAKTAAHPAVSYNYDAIGHMLSLTDQEGAATTFIYDARGLLLKRTDPLGKETTFAYDDAGRLISRTDRNNNTIAFTYTQSDKIRTITYPDSSQVIFTYNLHDKLVSMQDPAGITTYTYDDVYRLKSVTNPHGQVISYEYDKVGDVTKITYPDNKSVTYTYDACNRLKTVNVNWLSKTATYTYDDAGRLTKLANFNGTITNYGYDDANRLVSIENKTSSTGTTISSYSFTLDANGNRTQVLQTEPLPPAMPQDSRDFIYNLTKNRLLSAGTTDFTYNDEGELATKDTASYTFDYEHRLKSIGGDSSAQFIYDGTGNRLQATRNGAVTRYIYDARGNLLAEADSSNNITRYYIYGLGLIAMATPANQVYTYHYNGIGSTIAMTDSSKNIVNKYAYSPFGRLIGEEGTISQPFKYAGRYGIMAEGSSLYYMRARYYDAEIGRFISEDPSGFDGGINLYAYCNNNPVNFVDPLGLEAGGTSSWADIALPIIGLSIVGLTADDVTVIGVIDDPLIPALVAAGAGIAILQAQQHATDSRRTSGGYTFDELKTETRMSPGMPGLPPGGPPPPPGWQKWGFIAGKLLELTWRLFGPK